MATQPASIPTDELTRLLTIALLGGQNPEAVEMGRGVRPDYGLGGASIAPAQKSAYDPTLQAGEWEAMSDEEHRARLAGQLADIFLGAGAALGAPAKLPGVGGAGAPELKAPASGRRPPAPPGGNLPMSAEMLEALKEALGGTRQPRRSTAEPTVELRESPIEPNASLEGGSGGSLEAINRANVMRGQGRRFVRVGPGGQRIPATEDGGIGLRPGWRFGVEEADGSFSPL